MEIFFPQPRTPGPLARAHWRLAFVLLLACCQPAVAQQTAPASPSHAGPLLLQGPHPSPAPPQGPDTSLAGPSSPALHTDDSVLRSYRPAVQDLAELAAQVARLRNHYAGRNDVRISGDARGGQILVMAPPDVQAEIAGSLAQPAPPHVPDAPPIVREIPLQRIGPPALTAALNHFLAAPPTTNRTGQFVFAVEAAPGARVDVEFDPRRGIARLTGPRELVEAWSTVLAGLNGPQQASPAKTFVVDYGKARPATLERALNLVREGSGSQQRAAQEDPARFVSMLFQPPAQTDENAQPQGNPPAAEPNAGGPVGPVQFEINEELGVIVIKASERDAKRVVELIKEIERLSAVTQPIVEIIPLKHASGAALADLIRQLYAEVYQPRQGAVSITALIKPNSLLLIGRRENVDKVIDLVSRLDQPVNAASQFRVFRLRHAAAEDAKLKIDEFFAPPLGQTTPTGPTAPTTPGTPAGPAGQAAQPSLAARVLAVADFRSNSLIIQASPRDMAEVELLLRRLDTPTSAAVNELRLFTLRNSRATELAAILRETIQTQGMPQQARPAPAGAPGQTPAAARAPAAQSRAPTGRSSVLQLMTVDATGRRQLRSGILTDVQITADARANTLLVSAPAASIDLIAALIERLDQVPLTEVQIKVFEIANGDAASLVETFEGLFGSQRGTGQAATAFDTPEPSGLAQLHFSIDERTNSIIASGTAADLDVVYSIILRLESSKSRLRKTEVYRLKNSPAVNVAESVREFLREERQVQVDAPGELSPFEQIEREVVVVPEPVSNSLIISATPRYFDEVKRIVNELDERPPMVMIQVLIAEVVLNNTDEFGVELGLQDSLLFDRSLLGNLITTTATRQTSTPDGIVTQTEEIIQAATNTPGFLFNNQPLGNSGSRNALVESRNTAAQGLSHFDVGRVNSELNFGGFVFSAGSESVNVLIRALQECRRLDVLSRPQIMTLDNQAAFVQVGQQVPLISAATISAAGQQTNSIQQTPVGLILQVVPRINPDGLVVMEIEAIKSQVGPEDEGIPVAFSATGDAIRSPRIDIIRAQTVVSAQSGQTVVLGGLITKRKEQTHRRVPYIADIPILGHLFRYDGEINRKTELLIIMRPIIVRDEAEAERIKQVESARMDWILSDVIEINGPAGLRSRNDEWGDHETQVVYPDLEPPMMEVVPAHPDDPTDELPNGLPPLSEHDRFEPTSMLGNPQFRTAQAPGQQPIQPQPGQPPAYHRLPAAGMPPPGANQPIPNPGVTSLPQGP